MTAADLKTGRLLRQQAALAGFSTFALRESELEKILAEAARACAECLEVPFCKICRYRPEENDLLVEAGFGWRPDVIGSVVSLADRTSPQGRAFFTGEPVICDDLSGNAAFALPSPYADHGIISIVDVLIAGSDGAYGVLEIDSPELQRYDYHDVDFLSGFAKFLAEAVAAAKRNALMRSAVERMESLIADKDRLLTEKNLLAKELHHRVRNNFQVVHAMLEKQHEQAADGPMKEAIGAISRRVMTLATIHDHLLGAGLSRTVDVGEYLKALGAACAEVEEARGRQIELNCRCQPLRLDVDAVTVIGLVTVELISNSYHHAFPDGGGTISIALQQSLPEGEAILTLCDDGIGLAGNGDGNRHGLGLVDRLMQQIHGRAEVRSDHGTAWSLRFPVPRDEGSERQASVQKVRP